MTNASVDDHLGNMVLFRKASANDVVGHINKLDR